MYMLEWSMANVNAVEFDADDDDDADADQIITFN